MISDKVARLTAMFEGMAFQPFIDYVRFPVFRNLERNARINFTFPLTVFVGQNGCGKSSALQALYGCPKGRNVSEYWFNTQVDPIVELNEARNCMIYSYGRGGTAKEVLKTRINKAGRTVDNFDSSDPLAKYGMDPRTSRVPPVEKEVVYLNFRASQSAFEKAFHEESPPARGVQDFLRWRSTFLKRVRDGQTPLPYFRDRPYEDKIILSDEELRHVGAILGRNYRSASLIRHRLFKKTGYSVFFETEHARYSEAFAGSGETTITLLVHEVLRAAPHSLILLDEPETSLHPGAQKRLVEFLLGECIRQKHQVVVCTHSQAIVDNLPSAAIKVFSPTPDGRFRVIENVLPSEAFHFLQRPVENKRSVIVEDRLSKAILDHVLRQDAAEASLLEVLYFPGGAAAMKQDAVVYAREAAPGKFLVLDGTERPRTPIFDPGTITEAETQNVEALCSMLTAKIKDATGADIRFHVDGGEDGGDKRQRAELQRGYLRYYRARVRFLPFNVPEDEIWDDGVAQALLSPILGDVAQAATEVERIKALDAKVRFAELARSLAGGSTALELRVLHDMFIKAWSNRAASQSGPIQELKALFDEIKSAT